MINHVKNSTRNNTLTKLDSEATSAQALTPQTESLSLWNKIKLNGKRQAAQVEIEGTKINEGKRQAIATVGLAAEMTGTLIRVELGRVHGEMLAATGAAMFDSYKVIALEQASSRQSGTVVNTQVRNEHVADAQARYARGEFSAEQAQVAILTADDLQAETEARIAARHEQLTQAVDRNFDAAMAPIHSKAFRS